MVPQCLFRSKPHPIWNEAKHSFYGGLNFIWHLCLNRGKEDLMKIFNTVKNVTVNGAKAGINGFSKVGEKVHNAKEAGCAKVTEKVDSNIFTSAMTQPYRRVYKAVYPTGAFRNPVRDYVNNVRMIKQAMDDLFD